MITYLTRINNSLNTNKQIHISMRSSTHYSFIQIIVDFYPLFPLLYTESCGGVWADVFGDLEDFYILGWDCYIFCFWLLGYLCLFFGMLLRVFWHFLKIFSTLFLLDFLVDLMILKQNLLKKHNLLLHTKINQQTIMQ